jgi:plasmid stabilization system protein ParE
LNVQFLEAARRELRDAVQYYEAQRRGLGAEFRSEVRATIERIKNFPEAWRSLGPNTRRCRLHRFPYGVIYQASADRLLIVAVAHLHRDPRHWKDRLS